MKMRKQEKGITILGALAILVMVGFFVMCAIRMTPPYFEYVSVRDIISRVAADEETGPMSIASIRRKITNIYHTNQIYTADAKAIEIYRKKGETYIDAGYEVRLPIFWRIDAVLKFDDLKYRVGDSQPIPVEEAVKN